MSRCFPFPPPGYEIKARPDNVDLTIKEKQKPKKHKDKKDKDKKERSERKEEKKSEGKQKEGKDRKEKKHKDKKDKKKDKQRSLEEKKTVECLENHKAEKLCPDSKSINGVHDSKILVELGKRVRDDGGARDNQMVEKITLMEQRQANLHRKVPENHKVEKLCPDNKPINGVHDSKILVELGKRVRDDGGARDNQMVEKITLMEQRQANLHRKVPENHKGEKLCPDNKPINGVNDSKILVELGKRARDDGGARDNQMVEKIILMEQRQANLHGKVPENNNGMLAEASNNVKDKELSRMANGHSLKVDARGSRNGFVGENQIKAGDGFSQVDKVEKKREGKERNEFGNGNGVCEGKNEGRDKKRKAEDKKRKKESKKEKKKEKEKVKEMSKENIKQRANDGNFLKLRNSNPSDHLKESRESTGKSPTRKEPLVNGFLHDNGIRPDNLSTAAFSSHQVIQNGSGFHPSQSVVRLAVEKGAVVPNQKMNGKLASSPSVIENVGNVESHQTENNSIFEHREASLSNHVVSNGLISSHRVGIEEKTTPSKTTINLTKVKQIVNDSVDDKCPSLEPLVENGRKLNRPAIHKTDNKELKMNGKLEDTSSRPPSSASVKAKEKIAISMKKPPHPDLKYLSQILTVPTADPPQFDDQDWLYGCRDSQTKRVKLSSSQVELTEQVWAKAIQIESADVTAMPYVIPY